jgi:sirohydrochlorin cobaltochelatase
MAVAFPTPDRSAPMASAPMRYTDNGQVDWGNMWDSFCVLPREGGPPHRPTLLRPDEGADLANLVYQAVVAEIVRGVAAVSGLTAAAGAPGWVAVQCASSGMARWLAEAIVEENVLARSEGTQLFIPASAAYTLQGEIKNVVTALAKTSHYWREHLPREAKQAVEVQERLDGFWRRIRQRFARATASKQ